MELVHLVQHHSSHWIVAEARKVRLATFPFRSVGKYLPRLGGHLGNSFGYRMRYHPNHLVVSERLPWLVREIGVVLHRAMVLG